MDLHINFFLISGFLWKSVCHTSMESSVCDDRWWYTWVVV